MPDVVFRTLRHEYHLLCPDLRSAADMAFMEITPDMPSVNLRKAEILLELDQGYYRMRLADDDVTEGSAGQILNRLHGLIYSDMISSEIGCPILHCGTLVNPLNPSGRIAVLGAKGQGKTTLMLSLLTQGFQVEGDEHLVLRENEVVARPRTLRVKTGSVKFVPALADAITASPCVENWDGIRFYAFSPKRAALDWLIAPGSLDHLIIIQANHGGRSVLHPLPPELALKHALKEAFLPDRGKAAAFARLRAKILGARCHCLRLGDLDSLGALLCQHLSTVF